MHVFTTLLTIIVSLLATMTAAKGKSPPQSIDHFQFRPGGSNQLDCPAAHQSTFTGPMGGKWGILCGW
jgi:hypothetical protein